MQPVEVIADESGPLAYLVRAQWSPPQTEFVTPRELGQQLGMIVYPRGGTVQPHVHLPVVREVKGTTEVIIVRRGSCELDVYDRNRQLVATRAMAVGDIVLLAGGGHGFRMLEDTVLCEVKQGPYIDVQDKERI